MSCPRILSFFAALCTLSVAVEAAAGTTIYINEIRADQAGADVEDYVELVTTPGSLDGFYLIVLGDGSAALGSGVVERAVDLSGVTSDGYVVVGMSSMTLTTPDVTWSSLENSDNLTFLVVTEFTGSVGDDLDTDDDGELDAAPWTDYRHVVALTVEDNPPASTEYHYADSSLCLGRPCQIIGPEGSPFFAYACPSGGAPDVAWIVGDDDVAEANDTPGGPNDCGGAGDPEPDMGGDTGADVGFDADIGDPDVGDPDAFDADVGDPDADVSDAFDAELFDGDLFDAEIGPDAVSDTDFDFVDLFADADVGSDADAGLDVEDGDLEDGDALVDARDAGLDLDTSGLDLADGFDMSGPTFSGRVWLNEIRRQQSGDDDGEFVELFGEADLSLEGLWLVVLGDGAGADGHVEVAIPLGDGTTSAAGYLVAARDSSTTITPQIPFTTTIENDDNITVLLVTGFRAEVGEDLDFDDDGVLDRTPWRELVDSLALAVEPNPPETTEYTYGPPSLCTEGTLCGTIDGGGGVLPHVYRCPDFRGPWQIGGVEPSDGLDTPGGPNACGGSGDAGPDAGDMGSDVSDASLGDGGVDSGSDMTPDQTVDAGRDGSDEDGGTDGDLDERDETDGVEADADPVDTGSDGNPDTTGDAADTSQPVDSGTAESGCSCDVATTRGSGGGLWAAFGLMALAVARRRGAKSACHHRRDGSRRDA